MKNKNIKIRITEYGLKVNAHMEKGNTHYGIRYTDYSIRVHGKLALVIRPVGQKAR